MSLIQYTVAKFDNRHGDFEHYSDIGATTLDDALATAAAIAQSERHEVQVFETMNDLEPVAELNSHGVPVIIGATEAEWRDDGFAPAPDPFDEGDRDARLGR